MQAGEFMSFKSRPGLSNDAFFGADEMAFRLVLRLDGMPADAKLTTLRDGTNTVSPFVVLQAR